MQNPDVGLNETYDDDEEEEEEEEDGLDEEEEDDPVCFVFVYIIA